MTYTVAIREGRTGLITDSRDYDTFSQAYRSFRSAVSSALLGAPKKTQDKVARLVRRAQEQEKSSILINGYLYGLEVSK